MTGRPRIVQCCREMAEGGGVSGVALRLEEGFRAAGYECDRVTLASVGLRPRGPYPSRVLNKLVHIRDVVWYTIAATVYTRARYSRRGAVIICHNDCVVGDVFINHGLHKSLVLTSPCPARMLLRNPLHAFILVREELRHRLRLHRYVVTLCAQDTADIVRYFPSTRGRVVQLSNGVDWARFAGAGSRRAQLRTGLGARADEVVLLFVGHEFDRKGLYPAMAALTGLDPRHRLWVVGGESATIAAARAEADRVGVADRVRFFGSRRTGVEEFFGAADLFVLPSSQEATPLVMLEAMAAGAVPVITRVGAAPQVITSGVNGFLVERTAASIAAAVREATRTPAALAVLGTRAAESARRFDWSEVVRRYVDLVEEVFAARRGGPVTGATER